MAVYQPLEVIKSKPSNPICSQKKGIDLFVFCGCDPWHVFLICSGSVGVSFHLFTFATTMATLFDIWKLNRNRIWLSKQHLHFMGSMILFAQFQAEMRNPHVPSNALANTLKHPKRGGPKLNILKNGVFSFLSCSGKPGTHVLAECVYRPHWNRIKRVVIFQVISALFQNICACADASFIKRVA